MVALDGEHDEILLDMLMRTEGKAEIVDGRIIQYMPTGGKPSYAASRILLALALYEEISQGIAFNDNAGFLCNLPNRKSFSPDASFYRGPEPEMGFLPHPPVFAVEVRSENDYGPRMEREIAQKRADYFAAGTLVVWDVDLEGEEVVCSYSAQNPLAPHIFRRGEVADAEPALSGWTFEVNRLFRPTQKQEEA